VEVVEITRTNPAEGERPVLVAREVEKNVQNEEIPSNCTMLINRDIGSKHGRNMRRVGRVQAITETNLSQN